MSDRLKGHAPPGDCRCHAAPPHYWHCDLGQVSKRGHMPEAWGRHMSPEKPSSTSDSPHQWGFRSSLTLGHVPYKSLPEQSAGDKCLDRQPTSGSRGAQSTPRNNAPSIHWVTPNWPLEWGQSWKGHHSTPSLHCKRPFHLSPEAWQTPRYRAICGGTGHGTELRTRPSGGSLQTIGLSPKARVAFPCPSSHPEEPHGSSWP